MLVKNSESGLCLFSGVEPWHFYFVNGFLNFNVAFAMALVVLPFAVRKWAFLVIYVGLTMLVHYRVVQSIHVLGIVWVNILGN